MTRVQSSSPNDLQAAKYQAAVRQLNDAIKAAQVDEAGGDEAAEAIAQGRRDEVERSRKGLEGLLHRFENKKVDTKSLAQPGDSDLIDFDTGKVRESALASIAASRGEATQAFAESGQERMASSSERVNVGPMSQPGALWEHAEGKGPKDDPTLVSTKRNKAAYRAAANTLDAVGQSGHTEALGNVMEEFLEKYGKQMSPKQREALKADIRSVRSQEMGYGISAEGLKGPMTKDLMALMLNQPVSKDMQRVIKNKAKDLPLTKEGKPDLAGAREALKAHAEKSIASTRPEVARYLNEAFVVDEKDPAFINASPEQQKAARDAAASAASAAAALAAGGKVNTSDLEGLANAVQDKKEKIIPESAISQLPKEQQTLIRNYNKSTEEFNHWNERNHEEIMSLIHSGLPIEMVVMLVMARFNDGYERKLRHKMEQLGVVESLEKKGANLEALGFKSFQATMEEVRYEQNRWKQMTEMFSGIMSAIESMSATISRNIGR